MQYIFEDNENSLLSKLFRAAYPESVIANFHYTRGNGKMLTYITKTFKSKDEELTVFLDTFSEAYADAVENAIQKTVESSTRKEITMSSLTDKGLIVICDSLAQALQTINVIAPEHLELHVSRPMELLGQIRNAGAIFMGEWTPEAVGDYVAGPNHTLPTGGTARYASPLSVDEFVKKSSVIQYSAAALKNDARAIETIADHEGLWAHAQSVRLRMELMEQGRVPANASSTDTPTEQAKD